MRLRESEWWPARVSLNVISCRGGFVKWLGWSGWCWSLMLPWWFWWSDGYLFITIRILCWHQSERESANEGGLNSRPLGTSPAPRSTTSPNTADTWTRSSEDWWWKAVLPNAHPVPEGLRNVVHYSFWTPCKRRTDSGCTRSRSWLSWPWMLSSSRHPRWPPDNRGETTRTHNVHDLEQKTIRKYC